MHFLGVDTDEVALAIRKRTTGFRVPDAPHMEPEALDLFERSLRACARYLEYGAGGSTVMAARLGKSGVSIEGDPHFCRDVRKRLRGLPDTMNLIYACVGRTGEWGKLRDTFPDPWRIAWWKNYVTLPHALAAEGFYDLVLIDGRFRVACALHAISEAHRRGASLRMLVDDYDSPGDARPHYRVIERYAPLTRMAGRMAVFDITPDTILSPPGEDLLHAVLFDSR